MYEGPTQGRQDEILLILAVKVSIKNRTQTNNNNTNDSDNDADADADIDNNDNDTEMWINKLLLLLLLLIMKVKIKVKIIIRCNVCFRVESFNLGVKFLNAMEKVSYNFVLGVLCATTLSALKRDIPHVKMSNLQTFP